jgi:ABC-type multidrug transport system fused ATPase/permease subunit
LSSFLFFGLIAVLLHLFLRNHAIEVGSTILNAELTAARLVTEALDLYRELYVRDVRMKYASEISEVRSNSSGAQAEQTFLPNVSKYVLEISVILGSVAIAGIQFVTQTATVALASLGLFLIAGGRIAPALMRLQQSIMNIEGRSANLYSTLETIKLFQSFDSNSISPTTLDFQHKEFIPEIQVKALTFAFENEQTFLSDINLQIKQGTTVAIVGPSGSGKTTLANLLLGLLPSTSGDIRISGLAPESAIKKWPGAIAYVPQEVKLVRGSFSENIELGTFGSEESKSALEAAIKRSHLKELVEQLPDGIRTLVGESGYQLSGGQKQRLGLARAFYTNPKLIILDEATSALDSATEHDITDSLNGLRGSCTVVIIAHRLSTVRNADEVIYLQQGRIVSRGTFEEVRREVPNFDQQANLMGL